MAVCYTALATIVIGRYHIIEENLWFGVMQFCLVVTAYNFIKYFDLWRNKHHFKYKKAIISITIFCGLVSGILLIPEIKYIYPYIIGLVLLVLVYVYPSITSKNFRHYAFLKLPIVAFCWLLLISSYGHSDFIISEIIETPGYLDIIWCFGRPSSMMFDFRFYACLVGYFFFVLALCIPFEIKDLRYDSAELKTIPQVIGVRKTKWLGIVLTAISWYLVFRIGHQGYFTAELLIIHIVLGLAIWFSDRFKSDYYANFFVEAIPVLWLLIVVWF